MPQPPRVTPEQALVRLYLTAARRLRVRIRQALASGQIGTAAYMSQQLDAVNVELRQLGRRTRPLSIDLTYGAYVRGGIAVDLSLPPARVRNAYAFAGVNRRAAGMIAHNLSTRLIDAATLVGRRAEDAFRRVALEETGRGIAAGATRREVSALIERRLIDEAVTDALTGFVDAAGKRWSLDVYSQMVARTTTREAVSAGTARRMRENGLDLIQISSHGTECPICQPYEGNVYSLDGRTSGVDVIDQLPPFHPNCLHVAGPAEGNLDAFITGLENTPTDQLDAALGIA